ncbi:hypothetical protein [Klebsiella pneumoniae]|uniref:hypothetical protein n=1 Tax=Klebsiella pneumoniae TaxID=573 RepID=UPI003EE0E92C
MTDALTKEKIIDAMRSSTEGFAFLIVDSLEFELKRQLTEAEQQEVSTVVEQLVLRKVRISRSFLPKLTR